MYPKKQGHATVKLLMFQYETSWIFKFRYSITNICYFDTLSVRFFNCVALRRTVNAIKE